MLTVVTVGMGVRAVSQVSYHCYSSTEAYSQLIMCCCLLRSQSTNETLLLQLLCFEALCITAIVLLPANSCSARFILLCTGQDNKRQRY